MTAHPFFASYDVPTATRTGQALVLPLPDKGHLRNVTVFLATATQGPVFIVPTFRDALGPKILLEEGGWIRSDSSIPGSDAWVWNGNFALGGWVAPQGLSIDTRNDSGATVSVTVSAVTED